MRPSSAQPNRRCLPVSESRPPKEDLAQSNFRWDILHLLHQINLDYREGKDSPYWQEDRTMHHHNAWLAKHCHHRWHVQQESSVVEDPQALENHPLVRFQSHPVDHWRGGPHRGPRHLEQPRCTIDRCLRMEHL